MDKAKAAEILGVGAGASAEEIQKAYRRAAMRHHPDRNLGDEGAPEKFRQCKDAFEALSRDDEPQPFSFGGFDDFESLFGAIFGGGSRRRAVVELSFAEAFAGGRHEIPQGPWGSHALAVELPAGIASGSSATIDVGGREHDIQFMIVPSRGWSASGLSLARRESLTALDQILGAALRLELPDGSFVDVDVPPGLEDGQSLRLGLSRLAPYELVVELDFSKDMRLNDTDRKQLSKIRANINKRERANGK